VGEKRTEQRLWVWFGGWGVGGLLVCLLQLFDVVLHRADLGFCLLALLFLFLQLLLKADNGLFVSVHRPLEQLDFFACCQVGSLSSGGVAGGWGAKTSRRVWGPRRAW
jgi:hypothetical protein